MKSIDTPTPAAVAKPFAGAAWRDVVRRRDALPLLPDTVLLHAGPAFDGEPPFPVRAAAMQALVFEGQAIDLAQAADLLSSSHIQLRPAQDYGVVTPLAQVVSASMALALVGDTIRCAYAPLVEGPAPALRFGTLASQALDRLRYITTLGLQHLGPLLRLAPVDLHAVVIQALRGGDDCHARTGAANTAMLASLGALPQMALETIKSNPGFVLPILMAGAKWRLDALDSDISAAGGNGEVFGIRLRGEQAWRTIAAKSPVGTRFTGQEQTAPLGAIGDSAVLDFCGLGGQALHWAPELRQEWNAVLPADPALHRASTVSPLSGLVDGRLVHASQESPLVNLAVLDRDAGAGLIGRGVYRVPPSLFDSLPKAQAA